MLYKNKFMQLQALLAIAILIITVLFLKDVMMQTGTESVKQLNYLK